MKRSLVRYLPIAPNVAILVLAALLLSSPDTSVFAPPLLLPILNTAFLSIIPFAIAFLSGRTYIGQSRPEFLLFGCGMLVFGVASLVTGWGLPRWGHNFAVTVYNVGGFLGGLFHFGATAVLVAGRSTGTQTPRRGPGLAVVASYFSCVLAVTAISVLAAHGAFPVFFIQSQGPTIVRQIVLAAAVAAYALPAIVMVDLHATTQESLFRWYASALFLMAAGLGIVMTVKSVGSPLCWTGRAAQYAASLYFAAAMLTANQRLRKASGLQLPAYLRDLLGSRVEDSVRERTRELSELNEQLRRSEERFRLAAESAGFGFYEYDFESGETGYSAEFLKLFGLSPGATLGLNNDGIAVALHPDDRPVFLAAMTAANDPRGAGILDLEYRIVPAAGTLRWLRVRGQTTFSGRGADARPARANGIIQDITERRLREEALRRSEERYRTVADFTFDWEMWLDPEGRIIYCSPSCERITGYSSEEFMHDPGLLARIAGPDESPARRRHFTRADPGPVESFEYRILSRSGEQRWIGHVCRPVFSLDGAFVGRRVSNRDITGQKRLDDAYRSLVNLAPYGMAIIQAGRVVFVNPALIKIVRFDMDRLGEATAEELLLEVDEEYQKRVISYVTSFMAGGTVVPVLSFQLVHRDGVVRWVEARLSRIGHDGLPLPCQTGLLRDAESGARDVLSCAVFQDGNAVRRKGRRAGGKMVGVIPIAAGQRPVAEALHGLRAAAPGDGGEKADARHLPGICLGLPGDD